MIRRCGNIEKRIKTATFKHVESELFNYHQTVKLLQTRREELLYGSSGTDENIGGGKSNLPGDPTGRRATALVMDKRIEHLERIIKAIETVVNALPTEKQAFVRERYWTHPQILTWDGLALKLNCSRSALFYWRTEIVQAIANQMGWA